MYPVFRGVWRSLVARLVWDQEAAGSNPAAPIRARSSTGQSAGFLTQGLEVRVLPGALLVLCLAEAGAAQAPAPRAANPERPTVATHAYAVAPGFAELEQGVAIRGVRSFDEATSWDLNLKVGLAPGWQLGVSGTAYARTPDATGVGDIGLALKGRTDVSRTVAVAVVPSMTVPTGSAGLSAGRTLGAVVGVLSAEVAPGWHADVNIGPTGIGAAAPQWFGSAGSTWSRGRGGLTVEVFGFTAGGVGPVQSGALVALLITPAEWVVVDAGGVWGMSLATPDQLFLGLTTNLGRIFK